MNLHLLVDSELFASALRALTPILLAALAGALCERVGIFNVALEGTMLVGCFAGVAGSWFTGSPLAGVLCAAAASAVFSGVLAVGSVSLRGNAVVIGIAMNLMAVGLTGFLLRSMFGVRGTFTSPHLHGLPTVPIPGLESLPVLGPLVGEQTALTYGAWVIVPLVAFLLARHPIGLRLRAVGEHSGAARSLGISPDEYRYAVVLFGGALGGLAGAQLALGNVTLFSENMTAGRGWIAVVAVMLAGGRPKWVFATSALFALAESVGLRLQGLGLPQQITDATPYVVTLIALVLVSRTWRRRRAPGSTVVEQVAAA